MAEAGKGSSPRPFSVSQEKFGNNWDAIFGKKKTKEQEQLQTSWGGPNCDCHQCRSKKVQAIRNELGLDEKTMTLELFQRVEKEMPQRMILCPICGNKRCPKASDHSLECTNSNEPGQPGSIYK